MSLLLFLFYWIAIPVLVIGAAVWLWSRMDSPVVRGLIAVACVAGLSGLLWLAVGEKWQADRQVRELCAKDGGVRVYETVKLPAEKFDELKRMNFVLPDKSWAKPTDEYYDETDRHYYKRGRLNLSRTQHRIVRRSDGKVLGESVRYGRAGGDLPGPWHHSSFMCPDPVRQPSKFVSAIFVRGDEQ